MVALKFAVLSALVQVALRAQALCLDGNCSIDVACRDHMLLQMSNVRTTAVRKQSAFSPRCSDQWNTMACSGAVCHTCGERIEWLKSSGGKTDLEAKATVARDFMSQCGACEEVPAPALPAPPCEGEDCPMGWTPTRVTSGAGQWCEVGRPADDWSALKTCPSVASSMKFKVMTYNLFWWNLFGQRGGEGGRAGRKIATTSGPEEYDFIGFQECDDIGRIMGDASKNGLTGEYGTLDGGRALGLAYRKSRWALLESGKEDVGEDSRKQWYGKRSAQWGRFQSKEGEVVFFVNHHGPLPVSEGGGCAGSATAYNIMRMIADNAHKDDVVVLVGDFNAQAHSSRIQTLDRFMNRVYTGSSHGGVDHVFSNCAGSMVESTNNLGSGGSDHDALNVVFNIGAGETLVTTA